MWSKTYVKTINGLDRSEVWKVWTDVNNWSSWQGDIDFASLEKPFAIGERISFKPSGGPELKLEITEVVPEKVFTDLTNFPFAKMYDKHELIEVDGGLELRTTITVKGPLSFLWRKIVAEKIVADLPEQTERLIARTRQIYGK